MVGVAELVDGSEEQARLRCLLEPWVPGRNEVYIRLPLKVATGRQILASEG